MVNHWIKAHYLVRNKEECAELEEKIDKLAEHYLLNTHPLKNPEIQNSVVMVRKYEDSTGKSYMVCPFPDCSLAIVDNQSRKEPAPWVISSDSEAMTVKLGDDEFNIFYRYADKL